MLRSLPLLMVLLLAACAGEGPAPLPEASNAPQGDETVTLAALLSEPQRWSGRTVTLVAPAWVTADERILAASPGPAASAQASLWLAEAPPANVLQQLDGGAGFLRLHGRLSPPGAYGRDQRYAYQFVADRIVVIEPERTTVANLADNPLAIDGMLLTITGTLLLRPDSALLVDRVSPGGVPEPDARQIKLPRAAVDAETSAGFNSSGDVSWGPVRVVGWWQNASLAPFSVQPNRE